EKGFKAWGLSVRDITRAYANDRLLDDDLGVVVTTLSPGLAAAKAEVQVGDVIRAVNQQPVEDLDAFSRLYESSIETGEQRLLLELQRGRGRRSAVLRIDPAPEKAEDPPPVQIRQDEPATQPIP